MTYLEIKNQNSNVEIVDRNLITKLYQEAKTIKDYEDLNNVLESLVDLSGNLLVDKAYGDEVDWLNNTFANLHINIITGRYIKFDDDALFSRMMLYLGDGVGITSNEITNSNWYSNTTDPNTGSALFARNTNIISFNELGSLSLITNIPNNAFMNCFNLTNIDLKNIVTIGNSSFESTGITGVLDLQSIQTITNAAFKNCLNITEIHFGSTLTTMSGHNIFAGCTSLTTVTGLENFTGDLSSYLFLNCSNLTNITLNNQHGVFYDSIFSGCSNLEYIQGLKLGRNNEDLYLTFYTCSKLKCVDFDFSSTSCYEGTFYNCSSLLDLTTNDPTLINTGEQTYTFLGNKIIGAVFFRCSLLQNKSFVFPNLTTIEGWSSFELCGAKSFSAPLLTSLGNKSFTGSSFLTVSIPSVNEIPSESFKNCTSLTSINASSCIIVGQEAFTGCTSLTSIDLSSCTSLGQGAFRGCTSLQSVTLGSGITTLYANAFRGCTALQSIDLSNITTLGGDNYDAGVFLNCTLLATVIGLDSISSIGRFVFYNCTSLGVGQNLVLNLTAPSTNNNTGNCQCAFYKTAYSNVEIHSTIPYTFSEAFNYMSNLKKLDLSDAVLGTGTLIESYFYYSTVETVIVPDLVLPLMIWRLTADASHLTKYIILSSTPPVISSGATTSWNTRCQFYVPDAAVATYQTASEWSNIADRIHGLSHSDLNDVTWYTKEHPST